jgi:hypothetical protein
VVDSLPRSFDSTITMFVFLNGHHLLEYYFALADTRDAANEQE